MKTLKNRLKTDIKPCYLVEGDDYFLYEKALSMIKRETKLELEDFNFLVFDDENFSMKAVLDSCEVMPMGSEIKVVVIKNAVKVSDSDIKHLENYLANPVPSTVLVILDFYDKFVSIRNKTEFVDAKRMDRPLATSIIVSELKKRNKQISGEAVETLLDYCNGFLSRAMNELDKLCFYDTSSLLITKQIVEKLVHKESDYIVFELTEALGKRESEKALLLLSQMAKEQGVLALITNHFRRLFFISISDVDNLKLASLLGVKEYAIKKQKEQLKNFSKMQLKKIYALLEEIDYKIKCGDMLAENALYYLVFSILYM